MPWCAFDASPHAPMGRDRLPEAGMNPGKILAAAGVVMTPADTPLPVDPEERLTFEMLIADLSAAFVNVPADQVDAEINAAQRRLVECVGPGSGLVVATGRRGAGWVSARLGL